MSIDGPEQFLKYYLTDRLMNHKRNAECLGMFTGVVMLLLIGGLVWIIPWFFIRMTHANMWILLQIGEFLPWLFGCIMDVIIWLFIGVFQFFMHIHIDASHLINYFTNGAADY